MAKNPTSETRNPKVRSGSSGRFDLAEIYVPELPGATP